MSRCEPCVAGWASIDAGITNGGNGRAAKSVKPTYVRRWNRLFSPFLAIDIVVERQALTPNEGIRRSLLNGIVVLLTVGVLFGLVAGLQGKLFFALLFGLQGGLVAGLRFGLVAVIQHYLLRIFLWHAHIFPYRAIPFLEDATTRILLRRVGGGYSFAHRLLLDYFAGREAASLQLAQTSEPL